MSVLPVFRSLFRGLAFLLAGCWVAVASTPTVTTVAGGFIGDGLPATSASLAAPWGVVRDSKGNVYITDTNNCRVRRVSPSGIISTFAGTGICGYGGDGGPARSAMISDVSGIAIDAHAGALIIADSSNSRVRMISASGIITTIAGNGTFGYSGDGDSAIQASLSRPVGVFVTAAGAIYIADQLNYVVRMVDGSGIIHTVAGNGTSGYSGDGGPATAASLNFPGTVTGDSKGNLYIGDWNNFRVRKVDTTGTITTYAGNGSGGDTGSGGPATSAAIGQPYGLLIAGAKMFIAGAYVVWSLDLSTQIITLIAGTEFPGYNGDGHAALSTSFAGLGGVAIDSTGLYVVDSGDARVRHISSNHIVTTFAGGAVRDDGAGTKASLNLFWQSSHIAFDPGGNLYVGDSGNCRVRKVSPDGTITTIAGSGVCGYSGDGGPALTANLRFPEAVAVDSQGNIFIADLGNGVIRKVDGSGTITTFLQFFSQPNLVEGAVATGMALDAAGNLYASDGFSVVWKITPSGSTTIFAGVPFTSGYNGDGIPATQALLSLPSGLAVDSSGNLYITDEVNNRIRKVDTNGIISTIAGNGTAGFGGDGGLATSAMLFLPLDVSVDKNGKLYIADSFNSRIRGVSAAGIINTIAGSGNGDLYNGNGLPAKQTNMDPTSVAVSPGGVPFYMDQLSYRVRRIH